MKTALSSLSLVRGFWRLFALTFFAHLVLLTPASGRAQGASDADLERAAIREGRLRIAVFPAFTRLAEAFEKKYGIKIEGSYVGEPDIVRRVSTESEGGIFQTDLFSASPGPGGSQLNKWAMPYTPKGFEKVAHVKEALPAGWHHIPLVNQVVGVIYNKDLVPPHEVPKSIYDLLKPEFKGRIISRTPWLSSILRRRLEATRSANTPGSVTLSVTITISGGRFFRFRICSIFSLTLRIKASTSMDDSGSVGSTTFWILTSKNGRSLR